MARVGGPGYPCSYKAGLCAAEGTVLPRGPTVSCQRLSLAAGEGLQARFPNTTDLHARGFGEAVFVKKPPTRVFYLSPEPAPKTQKCGHGFGFRTSGNNGIVS